MLGNLEQSQGILVGSLAWVNGSSLSSNRARWIQSNLKSHNNSYMHMLEVEIPHLKNGEWLDFFYLSLAFPQQQMSSSYYGNHDPAATWLKWFIFNIYIFYLLSLERRTPYLCRCFETEVVVAACPGLCHDCPHWGMGMQGCLVCAAAENAYASTIWYLWV